jgi:hypothetical protein
MIDKKLLNWVNDQIKKGYSLQQLRVSLKNSNYSDEIIDEIFSKVNSKSSNSIGKFFYLVYLVQFFYFFYLLF